MDLVSCHCCGLLRSASTVESAVACPVCGWKPGDPIAPIPEDILPPRNEPVLEQIVVPLHESTTRQNRRLLGGLVLLAVAILITMLIWPDSQKAMEQAAEPEMAVVLPIMVPEPEPKAAPAPAPVIFPVGVPIIVTTPGPPAPAVIRLTNKEGNFDLDQLGDKNYVKLTGVIRKLTIRGLTDGAILDADELHLESLVVAGPIDRGAILRVKSPQAVVTFRTSAQTPGGVGGDSRVQLDVGGGSVTFAYPSSAGARIHGGARGTIHARQVSLGTIEGENTVVRATIQPPGSVRFNKLESGAKFHYELSDRTDPYPKVTAGSITGRAEFKRLEVPNLLPQELGPNRR